MYLLLNLSCLQDAAVENTIIDEDKNRRWKVDFSIRRLKKYYYKIIRSASHSYRHKSPQSQSTTGKTLLNIFVFIKLQRELLAECGLFHTVSSSQSFKIIYVS